MYDKTLSENLINAAMDWIGLCTHTQIYFNRVFIDYYYFPSKLALRIHLQTGFTAYCSRMTKQSTPGPSLITVILLLPGSIPDPY